MDASFVQSSFLGGQWSSFAQGRVADPRYRTALNVSLNGYPMSTGAWTKRAGFQFCFATRQNQPGRVIQFNFTDLAAYRVELTNGIARIADGASLVYTNDIIGITSISTATPAVVQTSGAHGWSTGNSAQILLSAQTDSSVAQILVGRQFTLTVVDATHVSLVDAITGAAVDGSTINWNASAVTAEIARILELTTPYTGTQWQSVRLLAAAAAGPQGVSEAVLLHNSYVPQIISTTTVTPTGLNTQGFATNPAAFMDGPYFDPPIGANFTNGATIAANNGGMTPTLTVSDATAIGPNGFVATDVGRHIRLYSEPQVWAVGTTYAGGVLVKYPQGPTGALYVSTLAGNVGNQPSSSPSVWTPYPTFPAAVWVWAIITAVTSSTVVNVTIQAPTDGSAMRSLDYYNVTNVLTWRMGVYGNTVGWPACGCYYQGRFWFSGAVGNRIDSSESNDLFVMSPTAADGTVGDANGISEIFDGDNTNTIYFMQPTSSGIICGTKNGEWLVIAPTSGPIAPDNIASSKVTNVGCANILPAVAPLTSLIVHKFQRELYEYFPDVFSGRITAPNLNELSKNLSTSGIDEIAYQSELTPIVWARCGNGSLAGWTYRRTSSYGSQPPDYAGAHLHTLGNGHICTSLTIGPSPLGTLDTLYLVENDTIKNYYHNTLSRPILDEDTTLLNSWNVDDGIVPYGAKTATVGGVAGLNFYGLNEHEGETVSAQVGGLDCGDHLVTGGVMFVPFGSDPAKAFTLAYLQSISSASLYGDMSVTIDGTSTTFPAVAGFAFTSQGQLLRPVVQPDTGAANGPRFGKTSREHMYAMLVAAGISNTVSVGTDFSDLRPIQFVNKADAPVATTSLFAGLHWDTLDDDYSFDTMLCWQVTRPVPLIVAAIGGFIHSSDR